MINEKIIIRKDISMYEALKIMDNLERKLLIICEDSVFHGVISVGDIQRALLKKEDLSQSVCKFVRNDIIFANEESSIEEIKKKMKSERIECMPVVHKGILVDVIEWKDVFPDEQNMAHSINYPVFIMAGGEGSRLRPLTYFIPKPLIPISDKTIIEEIMNCFCDIGCNDFYISVNYMADKIEEYFKNKTTGKYRITFVKENKPLGTGGSLFLLKDKFTTTFFVSNCDILVDINFEDLLAYHYSNGNIATVVSVLKNYSIPYGTLETSEGGQLTALKEKPFITYQINSGLYVLEPDIFTYMKNEEFIHITELFGRLLDNGQRVGVFPISEGSWKDIGNWKAYLDSINMR